MGKGKNDGKGKSWLVECVHSHLSDDKAVAKMGHPSVVARSDVGHPPRSDAGHPSILLLGLVLRECARQYHTRIDTSSNSRQA